MIIPITSQMSLELEKVSACAFVDLHDPPWRAHDFKQVLGQGGYGWAVINKRHTEEAIFAEASTDEHEKHRFDNPNQCMGYIVLRDCLDFIEILKIATHPKFQHQGVAQQLLEKALSHCHTRLVLEVAENNHRAIALYQKYGFQCVGRRKRYYSNGKSMDNQNETNAIDALILEMSAAPST
ncbi:MAG: GNAT family N-acetyltransferase [Holosporales bacterium]|jgi:ribosomal-protein-alanine N-acetyltransferase|nr:GNAT family N-acetyltransferase [Holosporales bacterium]